MKYKVTAFLVFTFAALLAFAQFPPETTEQATAFIPQLVAAIGSGNYTVAGGVVIMFVMVFVRQYALPKWKLSSEALPIIAALIGGVASAGLAVSQGADMMLAFKNGLVMSLTANGTWDLIGKYFVKQVLGQSYQATLKASSWSILSSNVESQ